MKYDIIGDIHGHVKPLINLLEKMGYQHKNGYYQHPQGRKAIFLGDFIDRGPNIRETLQLVKDMMDHKSAKAIMGNHEYNAICYHLKDNDGKEYLRKHTEKNLEQHIETLNAFQFYEKEWEGWINWFRQLPVFMEFDGIRIVHASWDKDHIQHIRQNAPDGVLPLQFIHSAQTEGTESYEAVERTLKGKEEKLANGLSFRDKDGHIRHEARIKWWKNAEGCTFDEYIFGEVTELRGQEIPEGTFKENAPYPENESPVFFGHYWLNGEPDLQSDNVVCLDYSIAKGGKLVAYQWYGEMKLKKEALIY